MTRYRRIIKKMGYLRDQEGILNRYMRESSQWKTHLENTRNFINNSFADTHINSVAVLGSGWLLDIPLSELARRFNKIYLVDIWHPPQIRNRVKDIKNIELLETDLSGGAVEQLWQITRNKGAIDNSRTTDFFKLYPPLSNIQTDAYISVNLLNQLDIILCDFLVKYGYFQQEATDQFRSMIQAFHIEWIKQIPGCIISDISETGIDSSGKESTKTLLYTNLPSGHRSAQWTWEFDTHGTYSPGIRTRMFVEAVEWA